MSAAPDTAAVTIRYHGPGDGAELWGGTQADFVLDWPGRPAREVAVLLQDAAAAALAEAASAGDGPAFREAAARAVGEAWLEAQSERGARIDSIAVISAATLAERPELLAVARTLGPGPDAS